MAESFLKTILNLFNCIQIFIPLHLELGRRHPNKLV